MEDDPFAFMRGEAQPEVASSGQTSTLFLVGVMLGADAEGKPLPASKELIGRALSLNSELGGKVIGCVVGKNAAAEAKLFTRYGLSEIVTCSSENEREAVSRVSEWAKRMWLCFFADTPEARRFGARVAERLKTGFVTGVTEFDLNLTDNVLEFTHAELEGKMKRTLVIKKTLPQMASLVAGASSPAAEDPSAPAPSIVEMEKAS